MDRVPHDVAKTSHADPGGDSGTECAASCAVSCRRPRAQGADDDEAAQADHRQPDVLSDVTRRDKSEPVPSADGGLTTVGLDMDVEDVGGGEMWSQGFHRSGREVLRGGECEAPLRRQEAARAWVARRSESAQACEAPPGEAARAWIARRSVMKFQNDGWSWRRVPRRCHTSAPPELARIASR